MKKNKQSEDAINEIEVIVDDFPEWEDAIWQLQGYKKEKNEWVFKRKPNAKPLSDLLRSGEPVPDFVALTIGQMLAPGKMWAGGKLVVDIPPTRNIEKIRKELVLFMVIRNRYRTLKETRQYKSIVPELAKEYGMTNTKIETVVRMTNKDFVLYYQTRLVPQKK